MNNKKQKANQNAINWTSLVKRGRVLTAVAFVTVVIFIVFVIYLPMANMLRDGQVQSFTHMSHMDYHLTQSALMRGVEAANSLSSRSMIRNKIGDYKDGLISFEELQVYTDEKYTEGAQTIEYLIATYRYVDGTEVAAFTNEDDTESLLNTVNYEKQEEISETGVTISEDNGRIIASIVSPIIVDDSTLGYDYVFYDMTHQIENINNDSISVDLIREDEYTALFENSVFIENNEEIDTIEKEGVYYTTGYIYDEIYIMTCQTQEILFENISALTRNIVITGIVVFIIFLFFLYYYIIRYLNRGLAALENSRDEYKNIAYIDYLTKAYSRSYLNTWNETVRKPYQAYSIILIDVDKFKYINDTFGHQVGDDVLSEISRIFKENTRHDDYFFRYGGDEFLLITAFFTDDKIDEKIQEITDQLKEIKLPEGKISISYGISCLEKHENLEEKINLADTEMYEEKKRKKGNYDDLDKH
jgi:diguanylate cyclase (GGDEF)-like protein